ncbi:protein kinase domain-containing protein [Pseudidiomarina mangrovi]|uniref:protein kinase domain-containing protein n=1 Tax=Pseudidiomarina mangrovi TaxID=2487133 RepID=UPI000FCB7742|nr:protein kinase [Pseudidiomarina mangrovi]
MTTDHAFALTPGTELNHYVIESVLGQGGFGVVYKAHHALLHETVVIKEFLPVELAGRHGVSVVPHGQSKQALYDDCLQRFLAEGRTLVRLRHPNVVRCRDLFNANGTAYLVMDFEDGLPLDELVKSLEQQGLRYSEQQLLHFLLPLCDGLEYIHEQGVLHRDIKPANVFIRRRDGSPVIIDFGAAKQNFAAASQSQAPYTEFYAPLEQIEGSGEARPSVDIHAFGGLMYRIVTGKVGPRAEARAMALINGNADPLQSAKTIAGEHYSQGLLSLIDCCLAFRPDQRPASMAEVRQGLQIEAQHAPAVVQLSQLDELLNLAGVDQVITDGEMQMLLNKAKALQIDAIEAQQYIVQQCIQKGWQLQSGQGKQARPEPDMNDFFNDVFGKQASATAPASQHIILDQSRITLCIERNSPALSGQELSEFIGIETAGPVFTPLVNPGERLTQAYTQVFSTAEDNQREVDIHLMRASDNSYQTARSVSRVKIGIAKPAAAGVPQIELSLYAKGNDLYLDIQRLDNQPQQPQSRAAEPMQAAAAAHSIDNQPTRIGGWLWMVLASLLIKLLVSSARLTKLYQEFELVNFVESAQSWPQLFSTSLAILAAYVVAVLVLLVLLWRCSRYFVAAYGVIVATIYAIDLWPSELLLQQFYPLSQTDNMTSVIATEWVILAYLLFSKRVKNTFVR